MKRSFGFYRNRWPPNTFRTGKKLWREIIWFPEKLFLWVGNKNSFYLEKNNFGEKLNSFRKKYFY